VFSSTGQHARRIVTACRLDIASGIDSLDPMSIITGRGDSGETDLLFSRRIPKTSTRIGALGHIDELNAALGLARAAMTDPQLIVLIDGIQTRLVALMGELATLPEDGNRYVKAGYPFLSDEDVQWLVAIAAEHEQRGVKFTGWAVPGAEGSVARAGLDFARTVARRAERSVLELHQTEEVSEPIRLFFNRLSDFLWILARSGVRTL
jgi:cob(I)alamin adenosyltransferase